MEFPGSVLSQNLFSLGELTLSSFRQNRPTPVPVRLLLMPFNYNYLQAVANKYRELAEHLLTSSQISVSKNGVFWDATPCGSCKNRRFGGTWRLLHQGDKNLTRATLRNIPEDTILHSHRRENLKSYTDFCILYAFVEHYMKRTLCPDLQ
jgi:hypothetical protein